VDRGVVFVSLLLLIVYLAGRIGREEAALVRREETYARFFGLLWALSLTRGINTRVQKTHSLPIVLFGKKPIHSRVAKFAIFPNFLLRKVIVIS
jgi:hypothetical protein